MANIYVFIIVYLLGQVFDVKGEVFIPRRSADSILHRSKRYNSGLLEEILQGNLERECIEESCTLEEAREIFENFEQTNKFWNQYVDGDQCQSNLCLNNGSCEDGINSYTCWCTSGFKGKNCEIDVSKMCSYENGGCGQFCNNDLVQGSICSCVHGYKLAEDAKSCEPEVPYPCGKVIRHSLDTNTNVASATLENNKEIVPIVNKDTRIVGGHDSFPGEIPWQVHLISNNFKCGFCGGSIINENWVVTAAHCLRPNENITVVVGEFETEKEEGTEKYHDVINVIKFPKYNASENKYNHDIALLQLKPPIEFNDYALPICLADSAFTEDVLMKSGTATVSGWGRLASGGPQPYKLQKVELPYVERTQCMSSSKVMVHHNMFCSGVREGSKDACQGDSGGPHATNFNGIWFLTGIVSWGEGCAAEGKYGVYTKVSRYYKWINHVTRGFPAHHLK
ncbi:coagulation factor IX [Latimeria chalumnae]|uniref:Coagulation factor IX n=1 Tax=Latimeria chalumnae TaxID=7897 RepID=M3XGM1_LATCH|nr:PREDICTED: coagulation factor IX [Latimeria chalumnae]|eukprot:XP_005990436.1 PREDICTED: coagulation factor IX [Latimeria chalumnae]